MDAYWNDGVARRIKVAERLRLACVAKGRADLLVDHLKFLRAKTLPDVIPSRGGDKVYLAYPHFRDRSAGLPDSTFEVTVPDWHGGKRIEQPRAAARRASLSQRVARRMRRDVRRLKLRLSTG